LLRDGAVERSRGAGPKQAEYYNTYEQVFKINISYFETTENLTKSS